MELLNALSLPRALTIFARKWLRANCLAADSVGNCVYVSGDVAGVTQVTTVDPIDHSKMPAIGIITSKESPTDCIVQLFGELAPGGSFTPGKRVFVGNAGTLSHSIPTPGVGGFGEIQSMGIAIAVSKILLMPEHSVLRRRG